MYVIGTAGHVDHGKTTLVEALTGINPDRLKEERERAMTIDLGFAWLTLPSGETTGVIDVPGHRDFIENMLAGVGGIDAALFVIAADEGVMPQTREHLAILDLLQIHSGIIALTKSDLVEADWLTLVSADIAAMLRDTALDGATVVPVSARTGEGLPELKTALQQTLVQCPPRPDRGRPRLPIDRVFSLPGFGTVVTGTLSDGELALGAEVEILPDGLRARVRGLQTHKAKIERAKPGSRVAANLAGIEVSQLRRGMVVALPGQFSPTSFLDARFRHLVDADLPLKHNAEVKLFVGAAEVLGTVRLLNHDSLPPGESAWVQIALAEPVVVSNHDRFILRRPSPGATIGGGVIVDPHPKRRHKRFDATVTARLETLLKGTPGEVLLQAFDALGPVPLKQAIEKAGLDDETAASALAEVREAGQLIYLDGEALVVSRVGWAKLANDLQTVLSTYHAAHPLRAGMPREEIKSRLRLETKAFQAIIAQAVEAGIVAVSGAAVRLASHQVTFSAAQQSTVEVLLAEFRRNPHNSPSVKECAARVGEEVFNALLEQNLFVQVSADVLFLPETYAGMVEQVRSHLRAQHKITVAETRDMFSTSRKYALALLEHLDAQGITQRVGDERILK
jgi:selenocysteine-specific elongation factor